MTDSEEEPTHLDTCYSVGSYGPFPITFYSRGDEVFYDPQEHGETGPFDSLKKARDHARSEFGATTAGFKRVRKRPRSTPSGCGSKASVWSNSRKINRKSRSCR